MATLASVLLTLRFPVIDLRRFCREDYPKGVRLPATWTEETDFVRYFGPVTRRLLGPVAPWVSERAFCKYDRAVRLAPSYAALLAREVPGVEFFGVKRRLYPATAHNELFYADLQTVGRSAGWVDLSRTIQAVLAAPATVRSPGNHVVESQLGRLGPPIAQALDAATTTGGPSGVIYAGAPCVVVEVGDQDTLFGTWLGEWGIDGDLRLNATTVAFDGRAIGVFLLTKLRRHRRDRARALRIHVLRLHAEREYLRRVARLLAADEFVDALGHIQLERVQWSLNKSLQTLTRAQSHGFSTAEITTAFVADRTLARSELEALIERVEVFRPVIRRRLRLLQEQDDANESRWRELIEGDPHRRNFVYVKEVRVSSYDQRGSQIGAAGDGASASNVNFGAQLNLAMSPTAAADLQLAIQTLRKHLTDSLRRDSMIEIDNEKITAVQVRGAIGSLSEAEEAIAAQDEQRAVGALRRSGRWLASFADRVGVAVAAGAIRATLGLS